MSKKIFLAPIFLVTSLSLAQNYNYELTINGEKIDINVDESRQIKTSKGETLIISLKEKDILTYTDEQLSFSYQKGLSMSKTMVEDDVEQFTVMNASGSGFIIQKYATIDPSTLVDLMISELTKESINYGYKKTEESITTKIKSGQSLKGKKVKLTLNNDVEYYTVAGFGEKDQGILVIIMITNADFAESDEKIGKLLLETLAFK